MDYKLTILNLKMVKIRKDISGNDYDGKIDTVTTGEELVKLSQPPIPHRRKGRMFCTFCLIKMRVIDKNDKGQDRGGLKVKLPLEMNEDMF